MKTYSPLFILAALGLLAAGGPAWSAPDTSKWTCKSCPYPKGSSGSLEVGAGTVDKAAAGFGDTTGLGEDKAHLVLGGSLRHAGEAGYHAELEAADLGLDTRSLSLSSGLAGRWGVALDYSELPRLFALDALTPFSGAGSGTLSLPAGWVSVPSTAGMALPAALQPVELGFKRTSTGLAASLAALDHWTLRMDVRRDVRDGTRAARNAFLTFSAELPAPVDDVTEQLEVTAAYATRTLQASLGYQLSRYRSGPDALTWDNPFWPASSGAARAQVALAPDNEAQQVFGSAGYQVLPTLRISADFALGTQTQDATLLPATLNPNLVIALPAASLDGRVDTFSGSVRISATPLDGLRLNASAARDVRDNQTDALTLPDVAGDLLAFGSTRTTTPFSLTRDRLKASADYRASDTLRLSAGLEQDNKKRNYHEAVDTRESTLWARVGLQPAEGLSLTAKASHADRSHSTYGSAPWFGAAENPLMRKYNLADRKRDTVGLRADWAVSETIALGVNADYSRDDYDGSQIGLTRGENLTVGADASAAFTEQTRLTVFTQTDRLRSRQAGSEAFGSPDWTAQSRDRFDVLGFGIRHSALGGKLDLGFDLTATRAISTLALHTAVTAPLFPNAVIDNDAVKLFGSYKLRDDLSIGCNLWYRKQTAADWRFDGVAPATVSNLLALGVPAPDYEATALSVALRYRF